MSTAGLGTQATGKRARAARWLRGTGIEIGALHNPLPVPQGVTVRYVDRMREEELRQHYPELANVNLVSIDFIGDAQNLSTIASSSVDFVIANHLVEHLEDPIRGLSEMMRVIRPGGVLYLALPDPRVTFDKDRPVTTIEHVVDEYRSGTVATRRAHYAEWVELVEPLVEDVRAGATPSIEDLISQDYSIHFHVWRPDDFVEVLVAARREATFQSEIVEFLSCDPALDNEFIFVLMKPTDRMPAAVPPLPDEQRVEHLEAEVLQWQERARAEAARAEASAAALAGVAGSHSWRLTAPLRSVRAVIDRNVRSS